MDIGQALTVQSLLTAAGAGAAALVIRQLVELLKGVLPGLDAKVSGALQAFILSFALYAFAWVAAADTTPNGFLNAVVSWLTCATAAVGINSAWDHARKST